MLLRIDTSHILGVRLGRKNQLRFNAVPGGDGLAFVSASGLTCMYLGDYNFVRYRFIAFDVILSINSTKVKGSLYLDVKIALNGSIENSFFNIGDDDQANGLTLRVSPGFYNELKTCFSKREKVGVAAQSSEKKNTAPQASLKKDEKNKKGNVHLSGSNAPEVGKKAVEHNKPPAMPVPSKTAQKKPNAHASDDKNVLKVVEENSDEEYNVKVAPARKAPGDSTVDSPLDVSSQARKEHTCPRKRNRIHSQA